VKPKLRPPEKLTLITKDHLLLSCLYYAGTEGKQTVPLILLHGWEGPRGAGSGRDCDALALQLQKQGHAVAVPDLRGHGDSRVVQAPGQAGRLIDRDKFRSQEFRKMLWDVEAVKKFLLERHNQGELNIELLGVVGFEMGAVVGLNWVAYDWSVAPLPTLKQGQDVKAFVLVSPAQSFRGLAIGPAMTRPEVRGDLSAMIVFGEQSRDVATAGNRIYAILKRAHRPIPQDPEKRRKEQDLFLFELGTSLQGTKLLASPALRLPELVSQFVELRLVAARDLYPWQDRPTP
jgi:pimeloyl-ACP methyl ester carboxylesterase